MTSQMGQVNPELHAAIRADIGELLEELSRVNVQVKEGVYSAESFGNYYVDLQSSVGWLRIIRDRGQYIVDGVPADALKAGGLWRAFDDKREFSVALLSWLRTNAA